ncbi:carboxypeptidase-like regulatory domain-containing protein [Tundrisphaera sp. TA3]|uniref:carboxypeptidase-like regulatory domain-containing protein n=1 Tax=Tundrisphaera sp. TA3 TaxID=3435775 RepID=UPI003EB86C15
MRRIAAGRIVWSWVMGLALAGSSLLPENPQALAQERPGDRDKRPAAEPPKAAPAPRAPARPRRQPAGSRGVHVQGRVVDDETGRPIEGFGFQKRRPDADDPTRSTRDTSIRLVPSSFMVRDWKAVAVDRNPEGKFDLFLQVPADGGRQVDGLRILADGYEPEIIEGQRFVLEEAGRTMELTVRLKRGRTIVGTVIDHLGRPASGARLYLLRPNTGRMLIRDDIIGEGLAPGLLDPSVTRATADAEGRFRLTGIGDAHTIGVSAPAFRHWFTAVPEPRAEVVLRLPEPATLRIPVKIEGDGGEVSLSLYPRGDRFAGDGLTIWRTFTVGNPGELVLRDIAPGSYQLSREKRVMVGAQGWDVRMESRIIDLESGRDNLADLVRKPGRPLVGKVISPAGDPARMIFVGIEALPLKDPGRLGFTRDLLDVVACDDAGGFRTARVPPGEYQIRAVGYRGGPRYGPFSPIEPIDFNGSATTSLPAEGDAPAVAVRLEAFPARQTRPGGIAARSGRPDGGTPTR